MTLVVGTFWPGDCSGLQRPPVGSKWGAVGGVERRENCCLESELTATLRTHLENMIWKLLYKLRYGL